MSKSDRKTPLGPNGIDLPKQEGGLPDWFHGLMSRRESEELLKNKETGTFMITLSQRTFGYVLSYNLVVCCPPVCFLHSQDYCNIIPFSAANGPQNVIICDTGDTQADSPCWNNTITKSTLNPKMHHWMKDARICQKSRKLIVPFYTQTLITSKQITGKERCRHFIINQLANGELVVLGDSCCHDSLPALIRHYQNTSIQPFGEKLAQSYIKFSEINIYDNIEPSNGRQENALAQIKTATQKNNKVGIQNGQRKQNVPVEDIAPPLPERKCSFANNDIEQIYSKPNREHHEDLYSVAKKDTDVLYSMVKETQISQKNMVKASGPDVLYSEVKLDHGLPSALGHLQSSSQSLSHEARKFSLDSRAPALLNSLKDLSECEVLEMKFATSIQTVNSKTITTPLLCGRGENNPFLYSNMMSGPEDEDTYEQLPFSTRCESEYEAVNQISNYSMSSMSTYDHVSTRTSKEVTSREFNKKVVAQESAYETVSREISKPAGRKQNIAKTEKPKRFFFGDKKK